MNKIVTLSTLSKEEQDVILVQIKEIFFLSSSVKNFESDEHKETFFKKWCGDYFIHYSEEFYLFLDDSNFLLGYLSGCSDSIKSHEVLKVPAQKLFINEFNDYPAHLHIKFHPRARGLGLGSILVDRYCRDLVHKQIVGVHLVTSPEALNVTFYRRLGFTYEVIQEVNGNPLLFMGKSLSK